MAFQLLQLNYKHSQNNFLRSSSLKWKLFTILDGDLKIILVCNTLCSIEFWKHFWISNDFLPRNGEIQISSFFCTMQRQILRCLINTLSKYIFMQWSKKLIGYLLHQKICFNFKILKSRVLGKANPKNHNLTRWR